MYSLIEKVIFLQDIDVFDGVRVEDLVHLAAIAEEVRFEATEELFQADEYADSLYVVIGGKIRLHRNGVEIDVYDRGKAVGRWALFDENPVRVGSAIALEETETLRIARDDFYDLLSDHGRLAGALLQSVAQQLKGVLNRFAPSDSTV